MDLKTTLKVLKNYFSGFFIKIFFTSKNFRQKNVLKGLGSKTLQHFSVRVVWKFIWGKDPEMDKKIHQYAKFVLQVKLGR